jgi:putative ABC transport system permease protein
MAVDLATKSLLHDKLRFVITVIGVAFAVTLVFVQVGLFLGLMSNASLTIEQIDADLWVTSHNTPNVDFAHDVPGDVREARALDPGVARADNLIVWFMNVNLPNGAVEGTEVYALEDFGGVELPARRDRRRPLRSAPRSVHGARRVREESDGAHSRSTTTARSRAAPEDHRPHDRREVVHDHAADVRRFCVSHKRSTRATCAATRPYILVKLAPGRERRKRARGDASAASRTTTCSRSGVGEALAQVLDRLDRPRTEHVHHGLSRLPRRHRRRRADAVHVDHGAHPRVRHGQAIGGGNRDIYLILGKQATIAAIAGFALGALQAFALRPVMSRIDLKLIIPTPLYVIVFAGAIALCLAAAMVSFRKVASIDPALVFRT